MPYLLAPVCYHEPVVEIESACESSAVFHIFVCIGGVDSLKLLVIAGRSRWSTIGMLATGIPPHLAMSNELTDMVKQTHLLKEALLAKCTELPSELVNLMLDIGAIPVTVDYPKALLNTDSSCGRGAARCHGAARLGGPTTDLKATWNLWHFGHAHDTIRPLGYLKKADLVGAAQATWWSKTSGVMKAIAQEMGEMKLLQSVEEAGKLSAVESSATFDRACGTDGADEGWLDTRAAAMEGDVDSHLVRPCC